MAGKPEVIVIIAIACKMFGFLWAIARQVQLGPAAERAILDHISGQGRRRSTVGNLRDLV
jgi:hypothetical protein